MKAIYKYQLKASTSQDLELPRGAKILTIQIQDNFPVLWAVIDTEIEKNGVHRIFMYMTGEPLPGTVNALEYISTVQQQGYVFHFFEG